MLKEYTQRVQPFRDAIANDPSVSRLADPDIDPRVFVRFMIEFCSRGVALTEPVDGWIRRAGVRTAELGFKQVGEQLVKHAKHEAGHHQMQIDDTQKLVRRFNQMAGATLDAATLLARPVQGAAHDYVQLHEEVIASDQPFRQVAIEREVEGLSVVIGPGVVLQCERVLGRDNLDEVSFLAEHVELDVGHTAFNEKLLGRLLQQKPDALNALVGAAARVLNTYCSFLNECMEVADRERGQPWNGSAAINVASQAASMSQSPLT